MKTFDEYNQQVNEKKDLSKYKKDIIEYTHDNDNAALRLLQATLTEDKKLIEAVKAINTIVAYENDNRIPEYTYEIYKRTQEIGRKKYGKEEWDKNIYNPSED